MKNSLRTILLSASLLAGAPLFAQPAHDHASAPSKEAAPAAGKLIPVTKKEAVWAAKERKTYPLDVCVSSGEKLGSMGKAPEYIYRVDGQPDRLVLFCCGGCEDNFMKDPAMHLAKIDAAAAAKAKK